MRATPIPMYLSRCGMFHKHREYRNEIVPQPTKMKIDNDIKSRQNIGSLVFNG